MASKIKVDQIEGQSGTTVTLPSGQTLDLSSGSVTLPNNAVDLASAKVTGTIPVAKGGTGLTSLGTAGQALKVNSGASGLEFGTISSGTYSVHAFDRYSHSTVVTHSGQTNYIDIANGNTVNFTPTSTDDYIFFTYGCDIHQATAQTGADAYLMMKAGSASIGSGDTKLNYSGQYTQYVNAPGLHLNMARSFILPCTTLTASTTYYVELAGGQHQANSTIFNHNNSGFDNTFGGATHYVQLIHYKKN